MIITIIFIINKYLKLNTTI